MPVSAGVRAAILRQAASGVSMGRIGGSGIIRNHALEIGMRIAPWNAVSMNSTSIAQAHLHTTASLQVRVAPVSSKMAISKITQTASSVPNTSSTRTLIPRLVPTAVANSVRQIYTHDAPAHRSRSSRMGRRSLSPAGPRRAQSLPSSPGLSRQKYPARRALSTDASAETTSTKNFKCQVAASYSAKQKAYEPASMTFNFNPYNRVKFEGNGSGNGANGMGTKSFEDRKKARPDTGQDAFFISRIGGSGGVAMGVADGVGGYSHYGIDSADFSHTLCENMALLAHNASRPGGKLHPRTLLHNGYQQLLEGNEVRGGASTACVGTVRPDGVLMVANLGDSGFLILRHGKVHYFSTPQTHAFNTPYQLSVVPPEVLDQSRLFGGDFLCDLPKDAQVTSHNLENGDVIVFATDGVWDNLFPSQILQIVCHEMLASGGWALGSTQSSSSATSAPTPSSLTPEIKAEKVDEGYVSATPSPPSTPTTAGGIQPTPYLSKATQSSDGTGLQSIIAKAIAARAKSASLNRHVDGPFAKEVRRVLPGEDFRGGKRDDICVVVGVVVDEGKGKAKGKAEE